MIRAGKILALIFLAGCAAQEEVVFVEPEPIEAEPILDEDLMAGPGSDCPVGDDDGIGGTGCEPGF